MPTDSVILNAVNDFAQLVNNHVPRLLATEQLATDIDLNLEDLDADT